MSTSPTQPSDALEAQRVRDEEIMARVRSGDRQAFAELVERWQRSLWRFFRLQGLDPEEAEDVCQETFLRIFRFRERYRNRGYSFKAFVFRVARNVLVDRARARRRRPAPLSLAETDGDDPRLAHSPASPLDGLDTRQAVFALPERLRAVVVLNVYAGLTYREIAAVLEIPVGTVKSRMFHAFKQLRETLHVDIEP